MAGKYRRHRSGADAQAVRSDYAQADGEQRAGGENYPEAERQPHASPTANAFTVGLYAGEGTLEVDVYGGSALELTVTLTKPDGSTEVKTLQNGGGLAKFENLATGTYKVKVDYTTPVFNVQAYTGSVDVTAAARRRPRLLRLKRRLPSTGRRCL